MLFADLSLLRVQLVTNKEKRRVFILCYLKINKNRPVFSKNNKNVTVLYLHISITIVTYLRFSTPQAGFVINVLIVAISTNVGFPPPNPGTRTNKRLLLHSFKVHYRSQQSDQRLIYLPSKPRSFNNKSFFVPQDQLGKPKIFSIQE